MGTHVREGPATLVYGMEDSLHAAFTYQVQKPLLLCWRGERNRWNACFGGAASEGRKGTVVRPESVRRWTAGSRGAALPCPGRQGQGDDPGPALFGKFRPGVKGREMTLAPLCSGSSGQADSPSLHT